MTEDIFSEIKDQLRPTPGTRARLFEALDAEPTAAPSGRRPRRWLGWLAAAAAVGTAALMLLPILTPGRVGSSIPNTPPTISRPAVNPDDYAEAYAAVQQGMAASPPEQLWAGGWGEIGFASGDRIALQAASAESLADGSGTWETNVQVAGIDEGDIVKSDGHSIFSVSGSDVVITSAAGARSVELSRIDAAASETEPTPGSVQGPVIDLMLHENSLVVLATEYRPRLSALPASAAVANVPYDASQTRAFVYDVTDPASPRFVTSLGQSGAYTTSRLSDGVLYLVTQYDVTDRDAVSADAPQTFVPSLSEGSTTFPVAAADLSLPAEPEVPSFQVISSIDVAGRQRLDTASTMGRSDVTYMSQDNLYLASSNHEAVKMGALEFQQVADFGLAEVHQSTDLVRVALSDGGIRVADRAQVPGRLLNQFALDEFDGHLRVALTMDGITPTGVWANYPAVVVLDGSLAMVGALPQLAVNEQIESVRFQGKHAYVISFRQMDPLFALDLSTPAEPEVMSALKIPGFSTYLHPWGDGRLLGLGMDVDTSGQFLGMKLAMYDTSDPFDVAELTTTKVPFPHAEALRNHKAVFVHLERALVGFAVQESDGVSASTETKYLLYEYSESEGFTLLEELPVQQSTPTVAEPARALSIGADLYVVSAAGIDVYDSDSLRLSTSQSFLER